MVGLTVLTSEATSSRPAAERRIRKVSLDNSLSGRPELDCEDQLSVPAPRSLQSDRTTWNPVTRCDRISPGFYYALTLAWRLKAMGQARYQNDGRPPTSGPGSTVTVHADALEAPLRLHLPRRVFVNSMTSVTRGSRPRSPPGYSR